MCWPQRFEPEMKPGNINGADGQVWTEQIFTVPELVSFPCLEFKLNSVTVTGNEASALNYVNSLEL